MNMKDLGLHGLIGGGGTIIKSIQRGQITLSSTTHNITINNIDPNNSIVILGFKPNSNVDLRFIWTRGKITSATNLQLTRQSATNPAIVYWTVIEFKDIKSLQKGDYILNTGTANPTVSVSINAVDINKALLFFSNYADAQGTTAHTLVAGNIANSNTIQFTVADSYTNNNIHWQIVELK